MSDRTSLENRVMEILRRHVLSKPGESMLAGDVLALCRDLVREENEACEAICDGWVDALPEGDPQAASARWCAEDIRARRTTA